VTCDAKLRRQVRYESCVDGDDGAGADNGVAAVGVSAAMQMDQRQESRMEECREILEMK